MEEEFPDLVSAQQRGSECHREATHRPRKGSAMLQRRFSFLLGSKVDSVLEAGVRVRRPGWSSFQRVADQLGRGKIVPSCRDAVLRRLTQ